MRLQPLACEYFVPSTRVQPSNYPSPPANEGGAFVFNAVGYVRRI